jgi:enoyl-CoA hydratase
MTGPEVIVASEGGCGRITLNRPKALHALTLAMCEEIIEALLAWESDPAIAAIVIDHSGPRGFCAGGDVRLLYEDLRGDGKAAREFFRTEYRMDHLLFGLRKPTACFMDGIVMGGGAGLAMACRYRIATEATVFAMPETGIGLFPDVGGGWFLSRLAGCTGEWLALTGARLDGADCLVLGLATHYVPRDALDDAKTQILSTPHQIEVILRETSVAPPPARIADLRGDIDRLFGAARIEDIAAKLKSDPSPWAAGQLAEIEKKSPRSCKVALRQLREGRSLARFSDNMRMEYRIAARIIRKPDFIEGVRAFLIDKDNRPRWSPPRFEDVTTGEIEAIFAPLPAEEEWTALGRD